MPSLERTPHPLTRRQLLEVTALAASGIALGSPRGTSAPSGGGARAVVATDGSGDFGPRTTATRTAGIQEAIDAVHARGGGVVHLRPGIYPVDAALPPPEDARASGCGMRSILLYDDVALRGEGMEQTIIRAAAKCNTNAILGWATSRVSIEDLTVDGAGLNAGYGVAIFSMGTSFSDVFLRRVKATGFGGSAIAVAGGERVVLEHCVGIDSKIGFELGAPSQDYLVLHCTAYGCWNGTLVFDSADSSSQMGNVRPRVIGGLYDGEGKASGVALWDCFEPIIAGVTAVRGVTTNIQISRLGSAPIKTPVQGGLIEGCLAQGSGRSAAGAYGVGAMQDGVRVVNCTIVGNEDVGLLAAPPGGGSIGVYDCTFRPGDHETQRHAIAAQGQRVCVIARGNLHDGPRDRFVRDADALAVPGSCFTDNAGFNPVGLLRAVDVPQPGAFAPNRHPYSVQVHIHSGKVTRVLKRDVKGMSEPIASASDVNLRLHPGEAVAIEYAERPEWTWFGD
jgi:hypothetical protein